MNYFVNMSKASDDEVCLNSSLRVIIYGRICTRPSTSGSAAYMSRTAMANCSTHSKRLRQSCTQYLRIYSITSPSMSRTSRTLRMSSHLSFRDTLNVLAIYSRLWVIVR